jgi:hypothetical protein
MSSLSIAKTPSALKTLKFLSGGGSLSFQDGNSILFDCLSQIHFYTERPK